jgi:hypothetical protein
MAMPMSPGVPPSGLIPTSQTLSTPLTQPGNRASFIFDVVVTLDGVEIDMSKLATQTKEEVLAIQTEEAMRRPTLVRPATDAARRKYFEEKRPPNSGRARKKKDTKMAKIMTELNVGARKRAKRNQEKEKRRRDREKGKRKHDQKKGKCKCDKKKGKCKCDQKKGTHEQRNTLTAETRRLWVM